MRTLKEIVIGLLIENYGENFYSKDFAITTRAIMDFNCIKNKNGTIQQAVISGGEYDVRGFDFMDLSYIYFFNRVSSEGLVDAYFNDEMKLIFNSPETFTEQELNFGNAVYKRGISSRTKYIALKRKYIEPLLEIARKIQEKERYEDKLPEKGIKTKKAKI